MVDQTKRTTVSVRIEEEFLKRLDAVTSIIPVNKSDFLRVCLEKLCNDNQMLIDHYNNMDSYVNSIRNELSKLPENMVVVKNGSWKDVTELSILILCDYLWKSSKTVFDNWCLLLEKYELETRWSEIDFSEVQELEEGLLGLESLFFLSAEKSSHVSQVDIPSLINNDDWIDQTEADRISLIVACLKAFEEQDAQAIIAEYLENIRKFKKGKPRRIVIDAKGSFHRSGSMLHLPVYTEDIQKTD